MITHFSRSVLLLKLDIDRRLPIAIMLVRRDGLLPPGNRKIDMFRSEEEMVNVVIGEATLLLLEDDDVISVQILAQKLKQMLEAEKEAARREIIREAIRQTERLLITSQCFDNYSAEIKLLLRELPCQQNIRL